MVIGNAPPYIVNSLRSAASPLLTSDCWYRFFQKIRNEWTTMRTIKIITDSSCDLPRKTVDEIGVAIVHLSVQFGEECMKSDMDLAEFYARMKRESVLPKTSSPSPGHFLAEYQKMRCGSRYSCDLSFIGLKLYISSCGDGERDAARGRISQAESK